MTKPFKDHDNHAPPHAPGARTTSPIPGTMAGTAVSPAIAALMRAVEERAAAERMLVPRVHELMARVAALEQTVVALVQSAVQQRWDGQLYLPEGRLSLNMKMNGFMYAVELHAPVMLDPPVNSPVAPSTPAPQPMPPPMSTLPTASSASLASMGQHGASSSWQSIAATNSVEDPLRRIP